MKSRETPVILVILICLEDFRAWVKRVVNHIPDISKTIKK
jgi:hypothetical protein